MKTILITIAICLFGIFFIVSAQTTNCTGAPDSRLVIGEQARIIAEGGSNLRTRPTPDAPLLTVIPQNELVPVLDGPFCAGGYAWWQVDYDDERGWVAEGTGEFYWLAPYIIQRAQIGTVRIEIQPDLVTGIRLERLTDPPRSQFVLEGYPVQSNMITPFIVIFDEAPDELDIPSGNAIAQLENLETGTRFVDLFVVGTPASAEDFTVIYHYMAITENNRFIDAYFPVSVANLPLMYSPPETDIESYQTQYFEDTTTVLDALSDSDFTPALSQLDGIVRSIQTHAPLENSDLFTYEAGGIRFDYNPVLATAITEEFIVGSDIPRHILLRFEDYPAGEALIRVYRTEDLSGNMLATLQQILSRQPGNPPDIPVPSQLEVPLTRDNLLYLNFANGEGVRYQAQFTENNPVYSYQGLSENGDYFVSALFSLEHDFPPMMTLDTLIESLQIGE